MKMNSNRIFSLLLVIFYMIFAYNRSGAERAFTIAIRVIFPLAAIWFGEALGGYIGPTGSGYITAPTPGIIVCILGWLLLLLPLIIGFIKVLAGSKH
jgi:hypothetical protein